MRLPSPKDLPKNTIMIAKNLELRSISVCYTIKDNESLVEGISMVEAIGVTYAAIADAYNTKSLLRISDITFSVSVHNINGTIYITLDKQ